VVGHSADALGEPAPSRQSWTYNATRLRNTQVDHSATGNLTSNSAYEARSRTCWRR
jgi:hypothetical protein